jgi:hypothetical protein
MRVPRSRPGTVICVEFQLSSEHASSQARTISFFYGAMSLLTPSRSGMSASEAPNPRHQNQSNSCAKSVLTAEQWMNAVSLTSTVTSSALRMSFISSHCNDFFAAPNETLQYLSLQEVRESYSMLNNADHLNRISTRHHDELRPCMSVIENRRSVESVSFQDIAMIPQAQCRFGSARSEFCGSTSELGVYDQRGDDTQCSPSLYLTRSQREGGLISTAQSRRAKPR